MKFIKYLSIIFLLLRSSIGYAQAPPNIIPNPSFEDGNYHIGNGSCNYYGRNHSHFNEDIQKWFATGTYQSIGLMVWQTNGSYVDWVKYSQCPNKIRFANGYNNSTDKFIWLASDSKVNAGIRAELLEPIKGGKYYRLRMKLATNMEILIAGPPPPPPPPPPYFPQLTDLYVKVELSGNGKILNVGQLNAPIWNDRFHTVERVFYVNPEYNGMKNIKFFVPNSLWDGSWLLLDDLELFEQCPEQTIRQNLIYEMFGELEEGNFIYAGREVTELRDYGDVLVKKDAKTTFKANTEVILRPGFVAERESDFTAKIAQCRSECSSSDVVIPREFIICDNKCIVIGGDIVKGMTYSWTSLEPDHINFLSSTNVCNPTFCPPDNASGTFTYNVTITNACGESTTKPVSIHTDPSSHPNPDFTIKKSNLSESPDNPSLDIATFEHTEFVSIEIMDCSDNVLYESVYKNGIDFVPPQQITWTFPGGLSPCGCYRIRVRSKNYCYLQTKEEVYEWTRPQNQLGGTTEVATLATCDNGNRRVCFKGAGLAQIRIQLSNRWGALIKDETIDATGKTTCYTLPNTADLSNGDYPWIITFIGCDGTVSDYHGFVRLPYCGYGFTGVDGFWNGDDYFSGVYYETPDGGELDSLYSTISPNPVLDNATIQYHIPKAGGVKISLMNSNFEQKQILLNQDWIERGDYEIQFSNEELPFGVNYYMIEIINDETSARYIKRFSVIH